MEPLFQIPGLSIEDMKTLANTRNYTYYCATVANFLKGLCPFCVIDPEVNVVIYENETCRAFEVPKAFRAKHIRQHILITPKRHILHFNEMFGEEKQDMWDVLEQPQIAGLEGGGLVMRFGKVELNAGSVRHLHLNVIVPDETGQYKVTLAKDPVDIEKKWKTLVVYEKLRLGATLHDLTREERILVGNL
jgi:diadenosine tetraphosphate (Ap4A) HIT family hydrolase